MFYVYSTLYCVSHTKCITHNVYTHLFFMYSTLHCVSHRKGITQKMYTHVFYVYSTGPGGEDLEGGYYDAGDNLKVICDHHY